MTREEAHAALKAKAVELWSRERFRGSRADAWRMAERALGICLDMFPIELEQAQAAQAEFYTLEGGLFA